MFRRGDYEIRLADSPEEIEQVHRLNYQTFVQEIPQHHDTGDGRLVDKFHAKNKYLMCLRRDDMIGMLSFHDQAPYSVADRLADPGILSAPGLKLIEIRLLAVKPEERGSPVLAVLVWQLYQHARVSGYTHFIISGVEGQQELYRHLGFEPLGPPVGDGPRFIPMWLSLPTLEAKMGRAIALWERRVNRLTNHDAKGDATDDRSAPKERATVPGEHGV